MQNKALVMMELIKSSILGIPLDRNSIGDLSPEDIKALYDLSKKHDLDHIVADALTKGEFLGEDEFSKKIKNSVFRAVYRYQTINYELKQICSVLEKSAICYVPLKGAVIRDLYPSPWMRTSCDIDILVKESDLDKVIDVLVNTLKYTCDNKKEFHDVSLYSKSGVHLELHFNIKENMRNIDTMLSRVWDYAYPSSENEYRYSLTNEYMMFYHTAHMSYHFVSGGCGVKPFIDLLIIKDKIGYDEKTVKEYCEVCGIDQFYDSVFSLAEVWFGDGEHNELTSMMESYVLTGGVYGTLTNKVALGQGKKGNKFKYAMSRIFVSYDKLALHFPILRRQKWLFPFLQIARWFKLVFKGRVKSSIQELSVNKNLPEDQLEMTKKMLKSIGL